MSSLLADRLGVQVPQIVHRPPGVVSLAGAQEAIELADAYGLCDGFPLDESQRFTLDTALGERADGSWAAATVGDFEPRQNGKNDTANARELSGLILFGERLIIHTAHEFSTANEAFLRLVGVFENWDDLRRKVARVRYANGEQGIELLSGQRLKYRARTGGSGRGFAKADLVVYDEAQHLQAEHVAASGPTRLANPNAQAWYMGSGGLGTSQLAWRMRRRALAGDGGRFAYVEHTAEQVELVAGEVQTSRPDPLDRYAWTLANPAYGRRISDESLMTLYGELGPELFARECLCVWDPDLSAGAGVFPADVWQRIVDAEMGRPDRGPVFGLEANHDRSSASIVVVDADGRGELVEHRDGLGWVVERVVDLCARHDAPVAVDPAGPAAVFIPDLEAAEVKVFEVGGREMQQACAAVYDDVADRKVRVAPSAALDAAAASAVQRTSGDAWVWARRDMAADVSPLVAWTLANWVATRVLSAYDVLDSVPG
jgi:hypothetical protein